MRVSACPGCGKEILFPETLRGQNVKCPHCAATFIARASQSNAGPVSPSTLNLVTCPACLGQSRVPADMNGAHVTCPHCTKPFRVPGEATTKLSALSSVAAETASGGEVIKFSCPRCGRDLEFPAVNAGAKISCPSCQQRLKVPSPLTKTMLGRPRGLPELVPPLAESPRARPSSMLGRPRAPAVAETPSAPAETRELVVEEGPDKGKTFPLPTTGAVRVGRAADAEVQLTDLRASRAHCRIEVVDGELILCDAETQQGTFVNGNRVTRVPIRVGDVIQVGGTKLVLNGDVANEKTVYGPIPEELRRQIAERPKPQEPAPPSGSMPNIQVVCQCGQTLSARAKYAGTRVRCPNCEDFVTLPGKAARVLMLPEDPPAANAPAPGAYAPKPAAEVAASRRMSRLVAYGLTGLLALALLGALASALWVQKRP